MTDILYFGRLSDISGKPSENVDLPADITHVRDLRSWAEARFQAEGIFLEPTVRIAVNGEIVDDAYPLTNANEIAFMPPVGGG